MRNLFDIQGRFALVVGASSGIGEEFALTLAEQGANVAIAARRVQRIEALKERIEAFGVKCVAVPCDVTSEESIVNCVKTVVEAFGRIDILCNNAGIDIFGDFLTYTTEDWDKSINTDIRGMFITSREVAKVMKEQNYGRIINTASIGGRFASAGNCAYYAAKGAVINFTRALCADLAPYNITANAIAPGVIDTELTHDSFELDFAKQSIARLPLKRVGKTSDLSGILLYFASDASSYCTGQYLIVDGGGTCLL